MSERWVTGRFNCDTLDLGLLTLRVSWSTDRKRPGYTWSSSTGASTDKVFPDRVDAQKAAEKWARGMLADALSRCP